MENRYNSLEEQIESEIDFDKLEELCEHITDAIREILTSCGLYFRIFSRVKSVESIAEKIRRGNYGTEENPKKIQDLLGVRVVLYYYDDLSICRDIMESTFKLVDNWSRASLNVNEFKATKINGVFNYPEEYLIAYKRDLWTLPIDTTFEIQFRTMFFEGWHEIEHDMRYKSVLTDDEFWAGNEELSRILNCILANLELSDWSLVQLFEQLSYNHYKKGNWELMLKSHFRIKMDDAEKLDDGIIQIFDNDKEIAKKFFKFSRHDLIKELLKYDHPHVNYNLIVKLINDSHVHNEEISAICDNLPIQNEEHVYHKETFARLESNILFHLELPLFHRDTRKIESEFNSASSIIYKWVRFKLNPVFEDMPPELSAYKNKLPGYQVKIEYRPENLLLNVKMHYIDSKLVGTLWHVHTSVALLSDGQLHFYHMTSRDMPRGVSDHSTFLKPSFMTDLSNKVGITDIIRLNSKAAFVTNNEEYDRFKDLISDHDRMLPTVAIVQNEVSADSDFENDEFRDGYDMNTFTINGTRLAKVVGHYCHVFMLDHDFAGTFARDNDIDETAANGCICIFWPHAANKEMDLFTRDMVCSTQFDFNKSAFHDDNINEKAFRHKLVQIIKDDNVSR